MKTNLRRYFYSSFATKIFATFSSLVAGAVSLRLYSDYLTVREFGILLLASQFLSYIPFLDGGVRTASNCKLLASESAEETLGLVQFCQKFYSWFSVVTVSAVLILMAGYWMLPNVRGSGESFAFFASLGVSMALLMISSAQGGLLLGLQGQNLLYLIAGAGTLINLLALAAGLRFGLRLWAFPLANTLTFIISWPAYVGAIRSRMPGLRVFDFQLHPAFWREFRNIRKAAFNSFRCQFSIMLLFSMDVLIVGACNRPEEVAVYGLFIRIFGILKTFIQSIGDVSWPLFAQNKSMAREWSLLLLRGNAWIHGGVAGAILVSLIPFLKWYMGPAWTGPQALMILILLRFVITGLQNPAAYSLISLSQFQLLARRIEFELIAAVGLSLLLVKFGAKGVATGFLIATAFGTLYPILRSYAQIAEFRAAPVLRGLWLRFLAAFAISFVVTALMLPALSGGFIAMGGALGAVIGISLPFLMGYLKIRRSGEFRHSAFDLKNLLSRI